jgi:hypothetical protein
LQFVEALDMMNKKFANPYILYYPVVSRDGMPFPVNRTVRDIQEEVNKGRRLREDQLWRGNLVAAKFADDRFTQMMDASMADFPILKNFLGTHASPGGSNASASALPTNPNTTTTTTHSTSHSSSPHSLPMAPLPSPHHPAGLPGVIARQMQFADPTGAGLPQAYDRDASAHAHGVPMAVMPAPRREHHHHHQQQPPMEL